MLLARPSTPTLERDDLTEEEDLSTPHAVRLAAFECANEAQVGDRTAAAELLGLREDLGSLGEEQLRLRLAGQSRPGGHGHDDADLR